MTARCLSGRRRAEPRSELPLRRHKPSRATREPTVSREHNKQERETSGRSSRSTTSTQPVVSTNSTQADESEAGQEGRQAGELELTDVASRSTTTLSQLGLVGAVRTRTHPRMRIIRQQGLHRHLQQSVQHRRVASPSLPRAHRLTSLLPSPPFPICIPFLCPIHAII